MTTSLNPTERVIDAGYELADKDAVRRFLDENENSFLAPLLRLIYEQTGKYFPNRKLTLEVTSDPEIPNQEKLFIGISTSVDLPEALHHLSEFDEEWWLEFSPLSQNKILIDVR